MADYANVYVKFKIKPQYKNAFETIFKRQKRNQSKYFDWFDYFSFITFDGEIKTKNPNGENEYLTLEGMGQNINYFGEYSEGDGKNKIDGDIVWVKMCKKWACIQTMEGIIEYNLSSIADEVYFCEMIAYDKDDEKYYRVQYDCKIAIDEDYPEYTFATLTQKSKILMKDEEL